MIKVTYDQNEAIRIHLRLANISRMDWILPALQESGEYLIMSTSRALKQGVDIDGRPFKPLRSRYINRPRNDTVVNGKPVKGGGRGGDATPILIRTGGMEKSLRATSKMSGTRGTLKVEPMTSEMQLLGSYHQSPKPGSKMPKRAWIGIRDKDAPAIIRIFKRHADLAIKATA